MPLPPDPALRRPVHPDHASGRLARSPGLLAALAARLTTRDRWLLRMLHEHRVLTTTQITWLAFGTGRAATARLLTLYQLRAIDRFRPLTPARSAPLHFVLDEAAPTSWPPRTASPPPSWATAATGPSPSPCPPSSPMQQGLTACSAPWPPRAGAPGTPP